MSRVRSFFLSEAERWMAELRAHAGESPLDIDGSYRAIRRFRGNAQMARFGGLATTARRLEARLRPYMGSGQVPNEATLRDEIRAVLQSLEQGVDAVRNGRLEADPKVEAGMNEQGRNEQGMENRGTKGRGVVSADSLEYRGAGALERALSLREALENAIVEERQTGPILDELFDLIRLGTR